MSYARIGRTSVLIISLLVFMLFFNFTGAFAAEQYKDAVSEDVIKNLQMEVLLELVSKKSNLSDAHKKLSTDLVQLINRDYLLPGQSVEDLKDEMKALKQFVPAAETGMRANGMMSGDLVYVYIYLYPDHSTYVVDSYAVQITNRDENNQLAVAWVEVEQLEALASLEAVRTICTVMPPLTRAGSVTSEGDQIHRADQVRNLYEQNGSGIKVGIISDGVDNWTSARNSGDLPADLNVLNNTLGGDEGTAMLEIVHDLAPGAQLYFHDAGQNKVAFNAAIDSLINAGCKIVCDDIGWITEPFFEDGIIARHVATVLDSNNIIYVTSAGNDAKRHAQALYQNGGGNLHNKFFYLDLPPGGRATIILQWNDKFGSSGNDYDLYLANYRTGTIVAKSEIIQNGNGDPLEMLSVTNNGNSLFEGMIVVSNYQGKAAQRTLELFIYPGNGTIVYMDNLAAQDSIYGHPAVPKAIAVGAIDVPNPNEIAGYSSQGPVTISYPAQVVRNKPDICGIAGVKVTGVGGFPSPFYGTSAAAPHVAAIAALVWAEVPHKPADEITGMLMSSAVDLGAPGRDNIYGYGRADALNAFQLIDEPPTVTGTDPANGAVNVPVTKTITVTFSENVQAGSNYGQISIDNNVVFTKSISGNKLTIQPGSNLAQNKTYTVTVPAGAVKDMTGNDLATGCSFSFTTQQIDLPPVVTVADPANGAVDVPVNKTITVTFSENVQAGSNYGQISIDNSVVFTKSISGNKLTIKPNSDLAYHKSYKVTIPAGAVKDMNGNELAQKYEFSFMTMDAGSVVSIELPSITGRAGQMVTVPVTLGNGAGVAGFQFKINYDAAILSEPAASKGSLIEGSSDWSLSYNTASGSITVIGYDVQANGLASGEGELVKLSFKIADGAQNGLEVNLGFSDTTISNRSGQSMPVSTQDGKITVIVRMIGDVNGDDQVNILDVVQTVNIVLGKKTPTPEELYAADANGDGVINVLDVVKIVNLVLGR